MNKILMICATAAILGSGALSSAQASNSQAAEIDGRRTRPGAMGGSESAGRRRASALSD
jgi:hypothetical protein